MDQGKALLRASRVLLVWELIMIVLWQIAMRLFLYGITNAGTLIIFHFLIVPFVAAWGGKYMRKANAIYAVYYLLIVFAITYVSPMFTNAGGYFLMISAGLAVLGGAIGVITGRNQVE